MDIKEPTSGSDRVVVSSGLLQILELQNIQANDTPSIAHTNVRALMIK